LVGIISNHNLVSILSILLDFMVEYHV